MRLIELILYIVGVIIASWAVAFVFQIPILVTNAGGFYTEYRQAYDMANIGLVKIAIYTVLGIAGAIIFYLVADYIVYIIEER